VNPQRLIDLVIGDMLGGVGVPMVSQFGANILKWNAKVLHYVECIFIFANKFLSQSGVILLFHLDDLRIFKEIREFLDNYSMSIRMKRVGVNNLPLCSTQNHGLKVHLPSHIFFLFVLIPHFLFQSSMPFSLLTNST
jgi:hypothetical protein